MRPLLPSLLGLLWLLPHTSFAAPDRAPSRLLTEALRSYEAGDYRTASRGLHGVVEGEGQDGERGKQRAQFFLGKALYHLKLHVPAMAVFSAIQAKGSAHPYHEAALTWLQALAGQASSSSAAIYHLGAYDPAILARPAFASSRDSLRFLIARGQAERGDPARALRTLRTTGPAGPVSGRSLLLAGLLQARGGQTDAALATLKKAGGSMDKDPRSLPMREMLALAKARAAWVAGQSMLVSQSYERLPQSSVHRLEGQLLAGHLAWEAQDARRAVETLQRLHTPRFSHLHHPEGLLIRAAIQLAEGQLDAADDSLRAFGARFPRFGQWLESTVGKHKDPTGLLELLEKVAASGPNQDERRMAAAVLADPVIHRRLGVLAGQDAELRLIQGSPAEWKATAVAGVCLQDLTLQKSLWVHETGETIKKHMKRLAASLRALGGQAASLQAAIARRRRAGEGARATVQITLQPQLDRLFLAAEDHAAADGLFVLELRVSPPR